MLRCSIISPLLPPPPSLPHTNTSRARQRLKTLRELERGLVCSAARFGRLFSFRQGHSENVIALNFFGVVHDIYYLQSAELNFSNCLQKLVGRFAQTEPEQATEARDVSTQTARNSSKKKNDRKKKLTTTESLHPRHQFQLDYAMRLYVCVFLCMSVCASERA